MQLGNKPGDVGTDAVTSHDMLLLEKGCGIYRVDLPAKVINV